MNQNKHKEKTNGSDREMDFYVPLGVIVIELEDSSEIVEGSED
jgi:hypothetical protein